MIFEYFLKGLGASLGVACGVVALAVFALLVYITAFMLLDLTKPKPKKW